jgi:hypothetical protein
MRVDRRFLGWSIFFIALVPVLVAGRGCAAPDVP